MDNLIKIFQINIEYIKTLRHILAIPATGATTQSASLLPAVVVPPAPGVVALLPASQIMLIFGKSTTTMWINVNSEHLQEDVDKFVIKWKTRLRKHSTVSASILGRVSASIN